MKGSILVAIGMAITLLAIGYFFSSAGHDHSKHKSNNSHHKPHMEAEEHHH